MYIFKDCLSGQITKIDYIEGKFINATLDKASEENED